MLRHEGKSSLINIGVSMYRKWSKTLLIAISTTALAFGIPNSASAQMSESLNDLLGIAVQNYM